LIANATSNGRVTITGIGCYAPERVMTNDELAQLVETSDEWIVERTGIRERRVAAADEALSDLALPAAKDALEQAGVDPGDVDLLVVATVTPDMFFPSTGAIIADQLGAKDAAAYDLSAGCTGFVYAIVQAHGMVSAGLSEHALVVGGDVLSKIVDWQDRSTCVLFGDGAGAVVIERSRDGGFLGFELGADGSGGSQLYMPAGGSRAPATAETVATRQHFAKMNGREVFKFATRVLVDSAEKVLEQSGVPVEDVDLYVPHQANVRIIEHARKKLGIPAERTVVNVDRYGNTSSGSIPLALGEAEAGGRLHPGDLVLMTGMGAGLTWGSALIEWTANGKVGS
jgi:3-oxoacyl-[acyl-carrier-protein] synthase-3